MMPYWSLAQFRSFHVPSDLVIFAQSSPIGAFPELFGSPFPDQFHFFVPSGHSARLFGLQPFPQMLSVTPLSPEVVPLSHTHVFSVAMSLAPIHNALFPYAA